MASRQITDLTPRMRELYIAFAARMEEAGIPFMVTCTSRKIIEQSALYAQGREPLERVNALRDRAGLSPITEAQNQYKVTWTLKSKHLVRNDEKVKAFDIALLTGRDPHWEIKADVNENEIPDYDEAGYIGEFVGLVWGGRFRNPDRCHFEEPEEEQ